MKLSLPQKTGDCRGFTLIELMVVIVILGILAGLIVPRIMGRPEQAKQVKARVQIESISTALKLYKLDNGKYPTTEQDEMYTRSDRTLFDIIAYGADGAAGGEDADADINSWESE